MSEHENGWPKLSGIPSIGKPVPADANFWETLEELHGGVLPEMLTRSMAGVVKRVMSVGDPKSKGSMTVVFEFTKGRGEDAMVCKTDIKIKEPTMDGDRAENWSRKTTVFGNRKGRVTVAPEKQGDMLVRDRDRD